MRFLKFMKYFFFLEKSLFYRDTFDLDTISNKDSFDGGMTETNRIAREINRRMIRRSGFTDKQGNTVPVVSTGWTAHDSIQLALIVRWPRLVSPFIDADRSQQSWREASTRHNRMEEMKTVGCAGQGES